MIRHTTSPRTPNKSLSSTRTVTLVSNRALASSDHPSIEATTDRSQQHNEDEPSVKRAKIDSISSRADKVERYPSVATTTNPHDYPRDLDERKTAATVSSTASIAESTSKDRRHADEHQRRRRQSSSHSHHSLTNSSTNRSRKESTHRSKDYSRRPSSSNANRSAPLDSHPRKTSLSQRGADRNHRYPSSHMTEFTDRQPICPEIAYRTALSASFRSRPMDDSIAPGPEQHSAAAAAAAPVRHKRFNYNHQSVADHPRFANPDALASSTPLVGFDYARLSTKHYRDTSPVTLSNRK